MNNAWNGNKTRQAALRGASTGKALPQARVDNAPGPGTVICPVCQTARISANKRACMGCVCTLMGVGKPEVAGGLTLREALDAPTFDRQLARAVAGVLQVREDAEKAATARKMGEWVAQRGAEIKAQAAVEVPAE